MLPELSSGKMKTLASPLTADPGALRRDLGDHGGIELKLAVRNQVGRPRAEGLGGFPDRRRRGVAGVPLGRKRQHGHSRFDFEKRARVLRRGQRNLRQLSGAWLRHDRAIREEAGAIRADVLLRRDHQKEARNKRESRRQPEGPQRGADRIRRGRERAADGAVCVARCNHQIGEDTRQPRRLKGLRLGHSPRAAALVESLRVRLKLPASRGIEERGAPERDAQSPQPRLDFVNVP